MNKAKLDLLENISGIEIEMPGIHQITEDSQVEAPVEGGRKWAFNKMLIIIAPIAVVTLLFSGVLVYYLTKNISPVSQTQKTTQKSKTLPVNQADVRQPEQKAGKTRDSGNQTAAMTETLNIIFLRDFMIDLKDSKGSNYVLMCDVAFDVVDKTRLDQVENNTDIRNIIYRAAQSRSVVALRSVEERKKIKKELVSELGKVLGEGSVKNVYFLNYFIM
jgi:flagellar basal body-associated protein FliL